MHVVLQVIKFGLRDTGAVRIKQATMEFVVWTFQQAGDSQMQEMAQDAFAGIMHLLKNSNAGDHGAGATQLRGFLYQAMGQLAEVRLQTA